MRSYWKLNRLVQVTSLIVLAWLSLNSSVKAKQAPASETSELQKRRTSVSIEGEKFLINDVPTYSGRKWNGIDIEGLLINSRMVQATFDDLNPETRERWRYEDTGKWDASRNTREFLEQLPVYRSHGLLAVTINLQGGSPEGYSKSQPWHNSAIRSDGSLDSEYMDRIESVIDRADEVGMVIILGIYYFGQDQRLNDESSVIAGVDSTIEWLAEKQFKNVLVEINNECNVRAYDHEILKPDRVHELITRAKKRSEELGHPLLVGTSYGGGTVAQSNVASVSDFILLHGNGVSEPQRIKQMVQSTRAVEGYRGQPILFNEDDHYEFEKDVNNFIAALQAGASWGYFDFRRKGEPFKEGYQSVPVDWSISSDRKQAFFQLVSEITGERPE